MTGFLNGSEKMVDFLIQKEKVTSRHDISPLYMTPLL